MIDFRYHLVSLISVFLALAVGIVLGAGPLQGPIGSSLTSQVDGLRADRDQLRTELDVSRSETQQTAALVEATASDLVADSLTDRTIVLVRTAGADNDQADAMSARIEEAGGRVVSDLNLTETTFAAPDAALPMPAQMMVLGSVHLAGCAVVYFAVGLLAARYLSGRPSAAATVTRLSGVALTVVAAVLLVRQVAGWM